MKDISRPIYALTGSIGSGKSAASKVLSEAGYPVIDADLLAREVVVPGSQGLSQLTQEFGDGILAHDGTLNRALLAKKVFSDPASRATVERVLHPLIRQRFLAKARAVPPGQLPIIYAVPLFFERGREYFPEVSRVIVISAPRAVCLDRIVSRDGLSVEEGEKRLDAQLPIELKEGGADVVVRNEGSLDDLEREVLGAVRRLVE